MSRGVGGMKALVDGLQFIWFLNVFLAVLITLVIFVAGGLVVLHLTGRKIAIVRKAVCSYENELRRSIVLNRRRPNAVRRNQWMDGSARQGRGEPAVPRLHTAT